MKPALVLNEGQSLAVGRSSTKPTSLFTTMLSPVAPGQWMALRPTTPRVFGDGGPGRKDSSLDPATLKTLYDLREAEVSNDGATSAWGFASAAVARGMWADRGIIWINTAVGGAMVEEARGLIGQSQTAINSGRAVFAACQHVRARYPAAKRGDPLFSVAVLIYDQDNANKGNTSDYFYSQVEGWFLDRRATIEANGGADRYLLVLHSGAGIYGGPFTSPDIHDVALRLARNRIDTVCWGPGYILESATGALAHLTDDPVHLAAIAQARKGVYQQLYAQTALADTKRLPLHVNPDVPLNATVTAGGLVTLTYENWRGTPLSFATDYVTDPGGNRPFGFAFAPAGGKVLSTTIRPRASSFTVLSATQVRFQLETIAGGADAAPGTDPYINVANYHSGAQENGPDRGARACLRNDGSADRHTITGSDATPFHFDPHDFAMPQRIKLTLV